MTNEAEKMLEAALKRVKLGGGFDPAQMGARIGLNRAQSETAARALANAGVLVLGFDFAAHFSPAYRKSHTPASTESTKGKKARRAAGRVTAKAGKALAK
ncbi:MAG TPA: hypothetical protein VG326_13555 [Tepidisphaeraceae bacterium]|jgi:hypothetical protein|nr:hypothetical protein [Tepidisphaeraceae bacterium]